MFTYLRKLGEERSISDPQADWFRVQKETYLPKSYTYSVYMFMKQNYAVEEEVSFRKNNHIFKYRRLH